MEEYIREAPRVVTVPSEPLLQLTYRPEEASASEDRELPVEEQEPSVGMASTFVCSNKNFDPTGWELFLVTTPSNNISSVNERQLQIEYLMGIDDDPPQNSTQYSALLAFEDYFRMEDDPPQDSTQHHSAVLDPFEDYSGEVPTSQFLEVPVSASQTLQNVSTQQHLHAQQYQPKPTPLQSFGHNNQIIQLASPPNKRRHDESPRSLTSDVQPLQDNLSDSVEPSKPTPHSTQQHPPLTSQCLEVPISTSQSLQNVSTQQHVYAQQYQPKPTPLQSFGHNNQIIQLPTPPNKRQKISSRRCGCKASKCQKRYCECYAAGEVCGENCSCEGCFNKSEYEATEKRNSNMRHNPQAVYGAPTLNSFAPPPANSFTTSSNISPPQAVQMATMARQQANPFVLSSHIFPPHAVPMADLSQQQANPFATSNISPLPAVQMAVMARPRANPGTTYQPQQQHMLMNPTNAQQIGHRAFSVNSGSRSPLMQIPPRLRQEANKINLYWKQLPRESSI